MDMSKVRTELAELIKKGSAEEINTLLASLDADQLRILLLEPDKNGRTAIHQTMVGGWLPEVSVLSCV